MSFLSSAGGVLGHLLGVDDSDVNAKQKAIKDSLASGALHNAANYGEAGQFLGNQAETLGHQNAALDWSKVDADDARLAAIRQHYADQFRNGGLAGQAAVQAAQSQRGLNAQGGIAGIRADTLRSGDTQGQVANTAQNEIAQAGDAANQLDTQKAAVALRKAVLAAQVSHANLQNHLDANQAAYNLRNSQADLFNQAQSSLNKLDTETTSTDIDQQEQQGRIGSEALQALLGAVGAGAGTAVNAFSSAASSPTYASTLTPLTSTNIQASPTGQGAGYVQPAAMMGRSAYVNQPIFATQPTLPNTANFFNRGA